jgi:hypothetical protein
VNRTVRRPMALALGALIVAGGLIVPATALAAGNTIKVVVPSSLPGVGGSFTANVVINNDVAVTSGQTTVTFDKTRLQLTAAAAGSVAGTFGIPDATGIANANATGKVVQLAFSLNPPANVAGDAADKTWVALTFQVIACGGTGSLSIPANTGSITEDSYLINQAGDPVPNLVTSNADVTIPCPTPTPTPAPQTPTPPPASAPPGSVDSNVTGTVDAGFLGITCPQAISVPLVRNATNKRDFTCTVFSNIIWTLTANDPKVLNKGFMTDGSKVLANPMFVLQDGLYSGNLANPNVQVGAGANSTNVPLTLSQFVAPQDQPGSYGMTINFAAVSGF